MGNISPRQSKSYHDGLNNHLSLSAATASTSTTPNRSSWKKQLQIINETLNIKKFSLIHHHHHGRNKRYRTTLDENHPPRKLSTSMTTQNFQEMIVHHAENGNNDERWVKNLPQENQQRKNSFKKSFSLFAIKQPLADSTNKRNLSKPLHHPTHVIKEKDEEQQQPVSSNSHLKHSDQPSENLDVHQQKRRQKIEITTGEYDSLIKPSRRLLLKISLYELLRIDELFLL